MRSDAGGDSGVSLAVAGGLMGAARALLQSQGANDGRVWRRCFVTGDVTPYRRAFASRNCVLSGANPCELVRTRRESVANIS
eukprot:867741-Prymnesium_polylepis.1